MTFNFDDVRDTGLSVNEFLTLLNVYLKYSNKDELDFDIVNKDYLSLEAKGMIKIIPDDNSTGISLRGLGKSVIEKVMNFDPVRTKNNSPFKKLFEEFWELYPGTDKHSIYPKTRALKSNRKGCEEKYKKLIEEGVKHEDIIKALRYEIEERKKTSGKDNKLSFMKNSSTWLNQREFEIIQETMTDTEDDDDWTSNLV